jgi:hypothetical protein
VANGRVAERWASPAGITRLESPVDATVDVHALGPRVVTMVRVMLSPGAVYRVPPAVVSAILLEEGTLAMPMDEDAPDPARVWRAGAASATASETVTKGQRVLLEPGDLLVPARDAAASLKNDGGGAATVLLTTIVDPATADGAATAGTEPADGVQVSALAGGVEVTPRFGEARLLIGRGTLAAGATLAPHAASDPELVFVESGALRLTAAETGIAVRRGADGTVAQTDEAVLAAGDGALVPPGALVDLRVDGSEPALLVMVRFVADDPGETESLAG